MQWRSDLSDGATAPGQCGSGGGTLSEQKKVFSQNIGLVLFLKKIFDIK